MRVCAVGGRVKNWYFSLKDSEGGVSQRLKYKKKTEHSEIKQLGNNNNSIEKGEVLRWSLRKKNLAAHIVPT